MPQHQSEETLENLIRQRAHHLWESEGRPDGRAEEHWEKARELVAIEQNQMRATKPNPQRADVRRDPRTGEPVEPLEAVLNQGEFPTLTDQGEEQTYPSPAVPSPSIASPSGVSPGTRRTH
jgi:hypothetical protein